MKNILLLALIASAAMSNCAMQRTPTVAPNLLSDTLRVAFYNVENLFDTIDSPANGDEEYTPTGKQNWTADKYQYKLKQLGKVIAGMEYPAILGLAEVENRAVLEDLVSTPTIAAKGYKIVHIDSPDERGIDCALLYDPNRVTYVAHKANPVNLVDDKTRDILEVTFHPKSASVEAETFKVYVNHWPSRFGGLAVTAPKRMAAATALRRLIEQSNEEAILLGDFNDEPTDASIKMLTTPNEALQFTNLAENAKQTTGIGTEVYKDQWYVLDQILVVHPKSQPSLNGSFYIFHPDWIGYKNKNMEQRNPSNTRHKGYSDHFPVYSDFVRNGH